MAKVFVLNGPNLNLLGSREPAVYGTSTLADVETACRSAAARHRLEIDFRQSNHEGDLVDALHEAHRDASAVGVVINAGAYTHTSIALRDAIAAIGVPVVEVHLSNVHAREAFRRRSNLAAACLGSIVGLGVDGYALAIDALAHRIAGGAA